MSRWRCTVCEYIYDPAAGEGDPPGTAFEDLPQEWLCPECGVGKEFFEEEN